MSNGNGAPWHRGSRFYRLGSHALYMAGSFVYATLAFRPELVIEAFGVFGGIGALLLGGGTWTNLKERDIRRAEVRSNGEGG